jgi:hypothetical protein
MPPVSAKNAMMQGAAADLGLGDMLRTQLDDETEEMKRRRLAGAAQAGNSLAPATNLLFGGQLGIAG